MQQRSPESLKLLTCSADLRKMSYQHGKKARQLCRTRFLLFCCVAGWLLTAIKLWISVRSS